MKIPFLGTLVLNRGDLLLRMIKSIDYPIEKLHIMCNYINAIEPSVSEALKEIQTLVNEKSIPVDKLAIYIPDPSKDWTTNLGCAGGWNKLIALNQESPYHMIVGSDVQFQPGSLQKMQDFVESNPNYVFMYGHAFNFYCVRRECVDKVGTFDENIYPAYLEDCDYSYRLKLSGLTYGDATDIQVVHGEPETKGSSTILSNSHYREQNRYTHARNYEYYTLKWGGRNEEEKFIAPFNDSNWPINKWELLGFREQNIWKN